MQKLPQNERLVRVVADSSSKRFVIVTFLIGFTTILAMFLVAGLAVPPALFHFDKDAPSCPDSFNEFTGFCQSIDFGKSNIWMSSVNGLTAKNAFLSVGGNAIRNNLVSLESEFIRC